MLILEEILDNFSNIKLIAYMTVFILLIQLGKKDTYLGLSKITILSLE